MRPAVTFISLLWAVFLSIAALWLPPKGVIDSSVLILLAQILVFIASVFGIKLPNMFNRFNNENSSSKKVA